MTRNLATWDRALRILIGLALLAAGWGALVTGTLGLVFKIAGFVPLLTGLFGYCPAYALLHVSTRSA